MKLNLIESKEDRQYVVNQNNEGNLNLVDILKKYGQVLDYMTEPMVAQIYGVDPSVINNIGTRNKQELSNYGYRTYKKSECESLKTQLEFLENIPNRGLRLYPVKAVIIIGMMLTESEVAAQLRNDIIKELFEPKDKTEERLNNLETTMGVVLKSLQALTESLNAIPNMMQQMATQSAEVLATQMIENEKGKEAMARNDFYRKMSRFPIDKIKATHIANEYGYEGSDAGYNFTKYLAKVGILEFSSSGKTMLATHLRDGKKYTVDIPNYETKKSSLAYTILGAMLIFDELAKKGVYPKTKELVKEVTNEFI